MILFCRNEISTCPAGTDLTLRLHGAIKFHPGKMGQFSTWYLFRYIHFFEKILCKYVLNYFFIPFRRAEMIAWEKFVPAKLVHGSTEEGFHLANGNFHM